MRAEFETTIFYYRFYSALPTNLWCQSQNLRLLAKLINIKGSCNTKMREPHISIFKRIPAFQYHPFKNFSFRAERQTLRD